ncbi:Hsp70 family protein [Polymorphospora rubra]|uniref:Hsp70 family protein n=1 Tax=Polymorphospora rubra TaxID=338584 RepID=UPI001BB3350D|nr:Hsp70 family protein [Polymorphospora rubra]
MSEPILVVDLGTSGTRAALVDGDQITLVKEPGGGPTWPSAICLDDAGPVVGNAAELLKRTLPRRYIEGPRRALDAQASMRLDDREISGVDLLILFVTVLRAEAARLLGQPPQRLSLTVPADYQPGDSRRDLMIAIGEAAGFTDVELLPDAVAAALDPNVSDNLPAGALVLVCDLGTNWTVGLVQVYGSHTTLLSQRGNAAGHHIDAQLISDLRERAQDWLEPLLVAPGDPGLRAYYEMIDFIRQLKHQLSGGGEEVVDHLTALSPPHRLTRDRLTAIVTPALHWLVESCHALVGEQNLTLADVAAVVLAGGGARLQMVVPAMLDGLGFRDGTTAHPLRRSGEPELAVLRGAARYAAGAAARVIPAERPRWQIEPLTWDIPGGVGRLQHWLVAEGAPFAAGEPVARIRTAEDQVFDLTVARSGTLVAHRSAAGQLVGRVMVAGAARDRGGMPPDAPNRRLHLESRGFWQLHADRQLLVECTRAPSVRLRSLLDGAVLGDFRPEVGIDPTTRGRVFLDPDGRFCLVGWDADGWFSVWEVETGKLNTRFRDPGGPFKVLVDETGWRLATEGGSRGVGLRRRAATTLWDLRTGSRLERLTDENWRRQHPGFAELSARDGFGTTVTSPDGQLRAGTSQVPNGSPVVFLHDTATDQELFRLRGSAGHQGRVGFSTDSRCLLVNWESEERSLVDVYDV